VKVVLVVSEFPSVSETFVAAKFRGLIDAGLDVEVVAGRGRRQERVRVGWPHRPRWLGALLVPAAVARCLLLAPAAAARYLALGWRRFGPDILRRLYLDAEILLARPDVLHFEFGALAVGRLYLRDLLGCRAAVSFRGFDLNHAGLDEPGYYDEVWRSADAVHVLSRDLWAKALRRGCPAGKAHAVLPPAVDTEFFGAVERQMAAEVGTAVRPLRLVSVGRLEWAKGYEYALQAVAALRASGLAVEYRIVGEGEHLEAVAYCRHQLGLEDAATFVGAAGRGQVRAELAWADVFLHAAVTEGFCNAVIEAQASGLPVVTSDAGGLPENVSDGVTGLVAPRRDPAVLADKIRLLAADPELRERMGRAGRERAQQQFSLQAHLEAFEAFYRGLAEAGRSAADERAGEPYLARRA
jgi:colanic acid/amylovoran biosynthesis glycosyltransferase